MLLPAICLFFISAGSVFGQQHSVVQAIHPQNEFIDPSAVSVSGLLGKAISISENGRLLELPEWNHGELITMFSREVRKNNTTTDWYGEHAGKWLYTTALAVERGGQENLKSLLFRTADYLAATQEADGYLGSYSPELRITNKNSTHHARSWDVWSLSYMTLGFLEVNRYFPNEKYLTAATKIGELFLKTFGDGSADITDYGTRSGISATIILDPVVELYKATGDKRYLDFAQLIIKEIEEKKGLQLVSASLQKKDLESVADGKAYQIIWNLTSLAKLYGVTGNPDYLTAVKNAWQNIVDYHLTIAGGPWGGIGKHKECFNSKGYWSPYGFIETCSIMQWIQLNKELLRLTGEAKYAQEIEKAAYNALPGAQYPNGVDWCYHSFSNGSLHTAHFNDCCPSSGAMALEELSPVIYSLKENGIACNLYTQSETTVTLSGGNAVKIVQQTGYPLDGTIRITLSPSKKGSFPFFIRIPDWAGTAQISVDGKAVDVSWLRSGTYFTLNRTWNKENTIEIHFPFELKVLRRSEYATVPQGKADIYRVNWIALVRGPLVYASNGLIDGEDRERTFHLPAGDLRSAFKPVETPEGFQGKAYALQTAGNKPVVFLPYYEAGGRAPGMWRLTWIQNNIAAADK